MPATDIGEDKNELELSCCIFNKSFSNVAVRFWDLSSSALVREKSSCKLSKRCCRSWWDNRSRVNSSVSFLFLAKSSCSSVSLEPVVLVLFVLS